MKMRLHAFEPASRANGPGLRAVAWFQGCTIGCHGCFNPDTHSLVGGYETEVGALVAEILATPGIEGVSLSGGEPFQQPDALAELVARLRETPFSILVFSGYTMESIRKLPRGPEVLAHIDVLVAGPYVESRHLGSGLLGSSNQRLHLLTTRYRPGDFAPLPTAEVILHRDGSMTVSGFRRLSGYYSC
ncbi:MAG: radical SAM protein [Acidobacteria bacterium]|nr:radical SAM protein [Acidobacteriota bacterium]